MKQNNLSTKEKVLACIGNITLKSVPLVVGCSYSYAYLIFGKNPTYINDRKTKLAKNKKPERLNLRKYQKLEEEDYVSTVSMDLPTYYKR
jgi:hypothetical protein